LELWILTQYLDLDEALDRAKERSQGQATTADDDYLTELLQMSAGIDAAEVVHYRPFLAAARLLEQKLAAQTLASADGAVFTGLSKPIESLLQLQAAYDSANALVVPAGFEAIPPGLQRLRSRAIARTHTP
jgi:hypothetical protein